LYLDGGLEAARTFILRMLTQRISGAARSGHQSNFKSLLQQTAQQMFAQTPQYLVLDEKGPDHSKCFEVCVEIGARRFGSCWGPSKKQAEQEAALQALQELGCLLRNQAGEFEIQRPGGVVDEVSAAAADEL
jgi:ribonuclease-3